jgi:ferric-dicitrate binding protein FerR (iron transport regulator)
MFDRFYQLVSKSLTATASVSEEQELHQLLLDDPELKQVYNILFSKSLRNNKSDLEQAELALATHLVKMQLAGPLDPTEEIILGDEKKESSNSRKKVLLWVSSIAACLLAFSGSWYLLQPQNNVVKRNTTGIAKNEVVTKKSSKSKIILPDGSLVWLNADSRISYTGDFQGETREMHLTGEAYFDIKKDKSRPFIIHTKSMDVRVLGTAFNLRSYPTEKTTETSLIRGSVEILLHHLPGRKPIVLKENEKLIINNVRGNARDSTCGRKGMPKGPANNGVELSRIHFKKQDSSVVETSWTENILIFDDEPFERVVANIERWYNVEFIIKNKRINSKRFSADFKNKSLSQVLEALSLAMKFKYHMDDNRIILNN